MRDGPLQMLSQLNCLSLRRVSATEQPGRSRAEIMLEHLLNDA